MAHDDVGKRLASRGAEFGSTTGRASRCGWFDAVALRHAAQINSISGLCITKLDVLDGMERIKMGVGYRVGGAVLDIFPAGADASKDCVRKVRFDSLHSMGSQLITLSRLSNFAFRALLLRPILPLTF